MLFARSLNPPSSEKAAGRLGLGRQGYHWTSGLISVLGRGLDWVGISGDVAMRDPKSPIVSLAVIPAHEMEQCRERVWQCGKDSR